MNVKDWVSEEQAHNSKDVAKQRNGAECPLVGESVPCHFKCQSDLQLRTAIWLELIQILVWLRHPDRLPLTWQVRGDVVRQQFDEIVRVVEGAWDCRHWSQCGDYGLQCSVVYIQVAGAPGHLRILYQNRMQFSRRVCWPWRQPGWSALLACCNTFLSGLLHNIGPSIFCRLYQD